MSAAVPLRVNVDRVGVIRHRDDPNQDEWGCMPRDWAKEPYRKLYIRESADDLVQPLFARCWRDHLLRKANPADGVIVRNAPSKERAIDTVVRICAPHESEYELALEYTQLWIDDGYLKLTRSKKGRFTLKINNFVAAQEARSKAAIRQERYRRKKAAEAKKARENNQLHLPPDRNALRNASRNESRDSSPHVTSQRKKEIERKKQKERKKDHPTPSSSIQARAQRLLADPNRAYWEGAEPHEWPEVQAVLAHRDQVWGGRPTHVRMPSDPRVKVVVARLADGFGVEELCAAIDGSAHSDWIGKKPELQTVTTLLRDGAAVDKYLRLRDQPPEDSPATVQPADPRYYDGDDGWASDAARHGEAEYTEPSDPFDLDAAEEG